MVYWDMAIRLISVLVFVAYNIVLFNYIQKILVKPNKNKVIYLLTSIVNFFFFQAVISLNTPHYLIYFLGFLLLTVEFSILSKSHMRQIVFMSSTSTMHISSIHLLVTIVLSELKDIVPYDVIYTTRYLTRCIIITFLILIVLLTLVGRVIPIQDIKRISITPQYSEMVSTVTLFIIFYTSLDAYFIIAKESYRGLVLVALSTVSLSTILFYYIFVHTGRLINMKVYKRKTDQIQYEYDELLNKKVEIEDKIIKDGLTRLYNRRFIDGVLKTYFEEKRSEFGILFIDVNALKYVNDTFGHKEGDRYLKSVAIAIGEGTRVTDLCARSGGDEFLVVLPTLERDDIQGVVDRIRAKTTQATKFESRYEIAVSIGALFVDETLCDEGMKVALNKVDELMRIDKEKFYNERGANR